MHLDLLSYVLSTRFSVINSTDFQRFYASTWYAPDTFFPFCGLVGGEERVDDKGARRDSAVYH